MSDINIREEAFKNPNKIVTDDFIKACEKDILDTIEQIERNFNTKLIGDRSFIPRLKSDLNGRNMGFAVNFIATWEAGIIQRYT